MSAIWPHGIYGRYVCAVAIGLAAGVSALPLAAADGSLGSSSAGSSVITLQIARRANFIITGAGVSSFSAPGSSGRSGGRGTASIPVFASNDRNQVGVRQFYIDDRETQDWFAQQVADNGEAEFSMCMPDGVDGQAIGILDADTGAADYITAVGTDDYALMVSVTPPGQAAAGGGSQGCASGVSSRIQVSMTRATAAGGPDGQSFDLSSKKPDGEYTKVNLIMVPE